MTTIDWTTERVGDSGDIAEVHRHSINGVDGWEVRVSGWSFWCESTLCAQAPVVGEIVRLVGGFGFAIRGIEIGGRCYRYLTEEQEEARRQAEIAKARAERVAKAKAEREERDRKIAALPAPFQARIKRFQQTTEDWIFDHEDYELFVCEEAAKIIAAATSLKTARATSVREARLFYKGWFSAFSDASCDAQRQLVPSLSDQHSGNTLGQAARLAFVYLTEQADYIPKMHGALCPLVGCKDAGCHAAYPEIETP